MALVKNNLVTAGLSGKLGNMLVFRTVGDKTVVSTAPQGSSEASLAQKATREKFQLAAIYGKAVNADPISKAVYEKAAYDKKISVYNVAVADFCQAPQIESVDLSHYAGNVNDYIITRVTDDFKVVSVETEIHQADGTLVEKGLAILQANGLDWKYTVTVSNTNTAGDKIIIKAFDLPGNETDVEKVV